MKFGNDGSQMLLRFNFRYMYMPVNSFNLIGTVVSRQWTYAWTLESWILNYIKYY